MRKITFSFLALLLTAVGAWAQSVTLQPSKTVDSPEFVYYIANGGNTLMDAKTAPVANQAPGRFAFFAVEGKSNTYKIMSVDATGENKWLGYEYSNVSSGQNKVILVAESNAKMWEITSSTIKAKPYKGYQLRAYSSDTNVSGQYMNWKGGVNSNTNTPVGFWGDNAANDTGSGWILTLAPMSGRNYYVFDKTHNVYLSLTKLKDGLATTVANPEICNITVADNGWKISTTGDTPAYLGATGYNTVVSAEKSDFVWAVDRTFDNNTGEYIFRLRNTTAGYTGFLGSNNHIDGKELYSNAQKTDEALDFKLIDGSIKYVNVTVHAQEEGSSTAPFRAVLKLPVGNNLDISTYLEANGLLNYTNATVNVLDQESQEFTVTYTEAVPFATSFDGLNTGNKWVSFFTLQGRMHVYDNNCEYNGTKKYPSIDRATFANLTDNKFWGFICNNPLTDGVKIVNKGADEEGGTLYLKNNGDDSPLLLATEKGSYITNEWLISKGKTNSEDGKTVQYYSIKAKGTTQCINNYEGKGFMTTYFKDGLNDNGSNIKFTSELDTYNLLKDRALNAPYNAVHSLTAEARALITGNTVADYKTAIGRIKELPEEGVVKFDENKYYYLRNYTPAGKKTYVLDYDGSANASTVWAETGLGSASEAMTYSNANALWQITEADASDQGYTGSEHIGVSKTIGRKVTHVNSGKELSAEGRSALTSIAMNETGTTFYFVNLGAGQHFIKNEQYNGTGQQAKAMPIECDDSGNLSRDGHGNAHAKNSRDTWYGIPVTSLELPLHNGGDKKFYATAYFPFAISIPATETVKAYTVRNIENGQMNLVEATGVIAACTAVILIDKDENTTTDTKDVKVNIISGVEATAQTNAVLQGVRMATTFSNDAERDNVLVLGKTDAGEVGFHLPATGSAGLRSNSAYISVEDLPNTETSTNGLKFNFGGVASGIDGVNADSNKGTVVYDLQGRRVNKLSKGLYIVNGKKVIL